MKAAVVLIAICANVVHAYEIPVQLSEDPISNITLAQGFSGSLFHIAVHVEHPFVFYESNATGNERFSGATIDILAKLAELLDFTFVLELGSDQEPESVSAALDAIGSGKPVGSEHWADVAAGAIHISTERTADAHFSLPYFETGYSLVVTRPSEQHEFWAIFKPFDNSLWLAVVIEMLVVAVFFYLCESAALSTEPETDLVDGIWLGLWDSLYWSMSALTQTLDKAPMTWGGKVVMLAHGWFMLIIIASYTANLASILTASSLSTSISGWGDITGTANGKGYKLALPRGLSQEDFISFEEEQYGFEFDIEWTQTWEDALLAVVEGKVDASFHDLPMVQYFMWHDMQLLAEEDRCAIINVGNTFAPVGYGLAFGLDSTDFLAFSQGIVYMKETGEISKILDRFNIGPKAEERIAGLCEEGGESEILYVAEMYGLVLMTALALLCGLLVNHVHRWLRRRRDEETFSRAGLTRIECERGRG